MRTDAQASAYPDARGGRQLLRRLKAIGTRRRLPSLFWELGGFVSYDSRISLSRAASRRPSVSLVNILDNLLWLAIVTAISVAYCSFLLVLLLACKALWRPRHAPDPRLLLYLRAHSYRVAAAVMKYLEGERFRRVPLLAPSLEIGIESGLVSALHFGERRFDIGVEYDTEFLPVIARQATWRYKLAADARRLPFKPGVFSTIVMVHVIDHIPEIDAVLGEVSRVLRNGGCAYVSGAGPRLPVAGPHLKLLHCLGLPGLAKRVGEWLMVRYHQYHYYTREQWEALAHRHGLHLTSFEEFNRGLWADLWVLNHYWFGKKGGYFLFDLLRQSPVGCHIERLFERMTATIAMSQLAYEQRQTAESGNDVFLVLQKPELTRQIEPILNVKAAANC